MDHAVKKLSIVCPAFQEEEVLPLFHREIAAVLAPLEHAYQFEFIYVDDGSRDRTLQVLENLAAQDPRVRFFSFSRNFGKDVALFAGLEHATGDLIVTMDSDLQHPPAVIPQLLEKAREGYEVVMTIRGDNWRLGPFKRNAARVFYGVLRMLSDTEIRPAGSDFLLMTRKALGSLLQMRERHRFFKGMVHWLGYPQAEVPFKVEQRKAGTTKFTFRRLVNLASDGIFSFSRAPLRLSLVVGALAIGWSFVCSLLWLIALFCAAEPPVLGMLNLISSFFLGGCILSSLGVVGEYVGRIYEQVKERPLYILKKSSNDAAAEAVRTSADRRNAA